MTSTEISPNSLPGRTSIVLTPCAVMLWLLSTSVVEARCSNSFNFNITLAESAPGRMTTAVNERCGGRFRSSGTEVMLKKLFVAIPPANGTVTIQHGGAYSYQPRAGYKGSDHFSFKVCGEMRRTDYCTVIPFNVTIE